MLPAYLALTGVAAGLLGGLFGVGGGVVMVPLLIWLAKKSQIEAQGISLFVILLPTALPAVMRYYKAGNLDLTVGLWVAAGFLAGGWLGSGLALHLPQADLKRWFGFFLIAVGIRFAFWK